MHLSATAATWFAPFILPLCLWVAWSDLRYMKIPNKAVTVMFIVYIALGVVWLLPLRRFLIWMETGSWSPPEK